MYSTPIKFIGTVAHMCTVIQTIIWNVNIPPNCVPHFPCAAKHASTFRTITILLEVPCFL